MLLYSGIFDHQLPLMEKILTRKFVCLELLIPSIISVSVGLNLALPYCYTMHVL